MTSRAKWTDRLIYSFDIESTSPDPLKAHVVSATIAKINQGKYQDHRGWFARPAEPIPDEAMAIHGITNEWIQEHGEDPKKVITEIVDMLAQILAAGIPLVVFNAAYDLSLVEAQAEYYGIPGLRARLTEDQWVSVIDPMVLGKGLEHFHKQEFVKGRNFKLPSLCERYGVDFTESHDATADAIGAGLLAIALVNNDEVLWSRGPQALSRLQQVWRKKAQTGLRTYFDKNNIEHDGVDEGWPLHSSLTASD